MSLNPSLKSRRNLEKRRGGAASKAARIARGKCQNDPGVATAPGFAAKTAHSAGEAVTTSLRPLNRSHRVSTSATATTGMTPTLTKIQPRPGCSAPDANTATITLDQIRKSLNP